MGESQRQHQHHIHHRQEQQQHSSRLGLRSTGGGEIVEVQGGHIVRSTGRKDRHSKVCTAKGPRDRRVRLSAHTAIQFYDVQDRLGYDRPSKAVDWLIKKAKSAIDELAELPAWQPTAANAAAQQADHGDEEEEEKQNISSQQQQGGGDAEGGSSGKKPMQAEEPSSASAYDFQHLSNPTSFLPPSLDSDAIADTIKSFFPMPSSSSSINFQSYPPDLLSRTSSQTQDLRLSLQSFQDPILLQQQQQQHHHHHHHHQPHHPSPSGEQALFTSSSPLAFDVAASAGWSNHHQQQHHPEMGRFQRMIAWNAVEAGGSGGGYIFSAPAPPMPLLGQNPLFPQRGPLQSSSSPSVRAWPDQQQILADHQILSSLPATGFASGGFSGFRIPARIQGEEEHDAVADKPSSASSAPRH